MDEIDTFNHILDTTARPKRAERPPYVKQPKAVKTAPLDATADAKTPATTGVVVQPINAGGGGSGGSGGGKAVVESKTDADGVEEDDIFSVTAPAPDYIPRDLHTLFKNVRDAPDKSVINYNIINKINKKMKEDGHKKLHGNAKSKESVLRGIEKAYNSSKL